MQNMSVTEMKYEREQMWEKINDSVASGMQMKLNIESMYVYHQLLSCMN